VLTTPDAVARVVSETPRPTPPFSVVSRVRAARTVARFFKLQLLCIKLHLSCIKYRRSGIIHNIGTRAPLLKSVCCSKIVFREHSLGITVLQAPDGNLRTREIE
jgi:hypothetical protein